MYPKLIEIKMPIIKPIIDPSMTIKVLLGDVRCSGRYGISKGSRR
jgi:hypothetical protein